MEFASCREDAAITCNASGTNYEVETCTDGCSAANRGCNSCAPDTSRCVEAGLSRCGSNGVLSVAEPCALGCVEAPTPHCAYLQPKYLPSVCDVPSAEPSLTISNSGTFDTSLDSNCNGGIVVQNGAPSICVAHYGTITIQAGKTLTIIGRTEIPNEGGRSVALVADGALTIEGTVDLGAVGMQSGPGGGTTVSSGPPVGSNAQGGAGGKTAGGPGGSLTADGGALNGGAPSTNPNLLTALVGGARVVGGGGGGGMMISCRGTVSVPGVISAGGGGGVVFLVAGGGGAGGNIVLQGIDVVVTGEVYANGGGGGAGAAPGQQTGFAFGEDGSRSDSISARGGVPLTGGGGGGDGGRANASPRPGLAPTVTGGKPGGGGGSIGFAQTYTPAGVTPTLTPAHSSPLFEPNGTIPTR